MNWYSDTLTALAEHRRFWGNLSARTASPPRVQLQELATARQPAVRGSALVGQIAATVGLTRAGRDGDVGPARSLGSRGIW
jgi:hypothetical protein